MFPKVRLRRLRRSAGIRRILDVPLPGPSAFIWPAFVIEGESRCDPIASMPGQYRLSMDRLLKELEPLVKTGLGGVLLFGVIEKAEKDAEGSAAFNKNGLVQRAIQAVKARFPEFIVAADSCVCAYTDHGHCGPLTDSGEVDNDRAIANLAKICVSQAAAGADMVAPSAMMDGQVRAIRTGLDEYGLKDTILMSYSTKFASSMYGPFRDAGKSHPVTGGRQGYQASSGNLRAALREMKFDEAEGADILMLKPALFYLDILAKMREITRLPLAAYSVSGEYAMLHAAALQGWGDLKAMARESMLALKRAGADILISYWANQYNQLFKD